MSLRLLFIRWHPSARVGGLAVNTDQLVTELARQGHAVAELTALVPRLTRPGLEAIVRPVGARIPTLRRRAGEIGRFHAVVPEAAAGGVIRWFEPDAVIVSSGGAWRVGWAQRMLDAVRHRPTVLYIYDIASSVLPARVGLAPTPTVASISDWVAGPVRQRGHPVRTIPPVMDRERYRVPTSRETVLLLNPTPAKGLDIALALANARPDVRFEFVGAARHPARRGQAPVPPNISWHGWADDPTQFFRRARLLLVPSRYPEAWPRVVAEAQASGIPALASDLGGMREAVGRGGRLVAPDADVDAWAAVLGQVLDDPDVYAELALAADREGRRAELTPAVAAAAVVSAAHEAIARTAGR